VSFRLRLILGIFLAGAISLGIVSVIHILFFRGIYLDALRSQGVVLMDLLKPRIEKEMGQNPASLEGALAPVGIEFASLLKERRGLSEMMIVDHRGQVLSHSNLQMIGKIQDPIPAALSLSGAREGDIVSWEGFYIHFIPYYLPGDRSPRFYLRLAYPKRKILLILAGVAIRSFAFSLLGLVLLVTLVGFLEGRLVGSHLFQLNQWLYRLRIGDYGKPPPAPPREMEFYELWEVLGGLEKELQGFTEQFLEGMQKLEQGDQTALSLVDEGIRKGSGLGEEFLSLEGLLQRLRDHLERLKEGVDLTFAELDSHREDLIEIAGGYLLELDQNTARFDQKTRDLEAHMKELIQGMLEVQQTTGESTAGTDELASEVSELAQAILQIRKSSELNKTSLEETVRDSQKGMELMSSVEERIGLVSHSITEVSDRVQNLIRQSERIGEILKVIQQITEKTNLLALNTAIIATQAGRFGGQFAVVADEIRDLSQRVKSNAEEVHRLVGGIREEIEALRSSFEGSLARVREGVERSRLARDLLSSIAERGEKILLETQQIFKTLEDQSEAAQALSNSMARFQGSLHIANDHLNRERTRLEGVERMVKEFFEIALRERNILVGIREKIERLQQFFDEAHKRFSGLVDEGEHSKRGIEAGGEKVEGMTAQHGEIIKLIRRIQGTLSEIEVTITRLKKNFPFRKPS
jgi:methyl-accepting chemotaxis protein